jgi:hypothetical protein
MAHSKVEFELREMAPIPSIFSRRALSSTVIKYFSFSERVAYPPFFHKDLPIYFLALSSMICLVIFLDNLVEIFLTIPHKALNQGHYQMWALIQLLPQAKAPFFL